MKKEPKSKISEDLINTLESIINNLANRKLTLNELKFK